MSSRSKQWVEAAITAGKLAKALQGATVDDELAYLETLNSIEMSEDILSVTGIGRVLSRISKGQGQNRALAKSIVVKWKTWLKLAKLKKDRVEKETAKRERKYQELRTKMNRMKRQIQRLRKERLSGSEAARVVRFGLKEERFDSQGEGIVDYSTLSTDVGISRTASDYGRWSTAFTTKSNSFLKEFPAQPDEKTHRDGYSERIIWTTHGVGDTLDLQIKPVLKKVFTKLTEASGDTISATDCGVYVQKTSYRKYSRTKSNRIARAQYESYQSHNPWGRIPSFKAKFRRQVIHIVIVIISGFSEREVTDYCLTHFDGCVHNVWENTQKEKNVGEDIIFISFSSQHPAYIDSQCEDD